MHVVAPEQYNDLLNEKQSRIETDFASLNIPPIEVFASQPLHFRLRTEFRVWHEGDRCFYAMFKPGTKTDPIEITDFPIASADIVELMPKLLEAINARPLLKRKLFQVEFLNTLSGDMLVTLIYHRQLDDEWQAEAQSLKSELGIHLIGRARKMRILMDQDYVTESLTVEGKTFQYKQIEGSFTQPNGEMNQKMLAWARKVTHGNQGDLLELYCGNGNFSIALADNFRRVVATEISKTSVHAANDNKRMNNIENLEFARVSAEEFTAHMTGETLRRRLKDLDLETADFQTVLVDPPRAGLDTDSCTLISQYANIVYVSCNPETLKTNLEQLSNTHNIEHFALFDQFPYTHHIECGVYLTKK